LIEVSIEVSIEVAFYIVKDSEARRLDLLRRLGPSRDGQLQRRMEPIQNRLGVVCAKFGAREAVSFSVATQLKIAWIIDTQSA